MSLEENKAIARRHFLDVFNQGHVELIDSYYKPDGSVPDMWTPQQFKDSTVWWRKAAPGWKATILDMIAEGEKVAVCWQADFTLVVVPDPTPDFPLPPLGKPVSWRLVTILCIVDGKVISSVAANEYMDMLVKAGVYVLAQPEPAQSPK